MPAGSFGDWLADTRAAIRGERVAVVPCGDCSACCTASQFVHVAPDEHEALAVIRPELLFAAPGFPPGHVLMGYDDRGHCPMFVDGRCSIYSHRPRACRSYDCRVFAAAGVVPDDPGVAARVGQWRFDYLSAAEEHLHAEIRDRAAADPDPHATKRALRAVTG